MPVAPISPIFAYNELKYQQKYKENQVYARTSREFHRSGRKVYLEFMYLEYFFCTSPESSFRWYEPNFK